MYMPALPAAAVPTVGELPLTPEREMTRLTGTRQKGWVAVGVREGVDVGVPLAVGVEEPVPVNVAEEEGVPLVVELGDGVEVDDGDVEPVIVLLAVPVEMVEGVGRAVVV